ncbi:MAG: hydroxyisourate hydrolase [Gemmatimonadaceae bacterium]
MTTISTHVLDTSLGTPAANIAVVLERIDEHGMATPVSNHVTDDDGRVGALAPIDGRVSGASYRLSFDIAGYFAQTMRKSFYTKICIDFEVSDVPQHYHVPLLLSPFGYSTYRGS